MWPHGDATTSSTFFATATLPSLSIRLQYRHMLPGLSIGDVLTLIQMTYQILRTIQDTSGSCREYTALAAELKKFAVFLAILDTTQKFLEEPSSADKPLLDIYVDAISQLLGDAQMEITQFSERLRTFEPIPRSEVKNELRRSLAVTRICTSCVNASRRLSWKFSSTRKDAQDLRHHLRDQMTLISSLRLEMTVVMLQTATLRVSLSKSLYCCRSQSLTQTSP